MSGQVMGDVFKLDLPQNKKLVLLAMAEFAKNRNDEIWPSTALIAWKTGYSERHTRRIIQSLIKDDKILKVARERPGASTVYRLNLSAGKQLTPFKKQAKDPGHSHVTPDTDVTPDMAVQKSDDPGHSHVTPTPDTTMSPESELEPSLNKNRKESRASQNGYQEKRELPPDETYIKDRKVYEIWNTRTMQHDDGKPVDVLTFKRLVASIFYAWYDALGESDKKYAGGPDDIWPDHRKAAIALAKSRVKPSKVAAFVKHKYANDKWWRERNMPIPLKTVQKEVLNWTSPEEHKAAERQRIEKVQEQAEKRRDEFKPEDRITPEQMREVNRLLETTFTGGRADNDTAA